MPPGGPTWITTATSILAWSLHGKLSVWRNNGDGTFVDATTEFDLSDAGRERRFCRGRPGRQSNLGVRFSAGRPAVARPRAKPIWRTLSRRTKTRPHPGPPAELHLGRRFQQRRIARLRVRVAEARDDRPRRRHRSTTDHARTSTRSKQSRQSTSTTTAGSDFVICRSSAGEPKVELWRNTAGRFADASETSARFRRLVAVECSTSMPTTTVTPI